ncbi:CBS-domain-containing protein [Laetiporus sulphureus 93-53]|uniref:CBS-domain-containing protein n=1 Tax=Laetiporus sulphureus 93-53 TaxID=1314785 RepID=A0A165EGS8_9APHY|nr:CBS-domain-containing protein [Laetiporus sulphureus 93-53]KZT07022.1 CBS-domain-containing protein [Laetiporus sulphureus 93-53]
MSLRKRMSISSTRSESPLVYATAPNAEVEEWTKAWQQVFARDLIDSPVVTVDADTTVEDACELLLSKDIQCLAVNRRPNSSPSSIPYHGLFDFADVNAFLTLAATRHRLALDELREKPRIREILVAAKAGKVPIDLVSNLSEKNPLETLPYDATLISLLAVVARGAHRVLIKTESPSSEFLGMVSDRHLLKWFTSYAEQNPSFLHYLSNPLGSLALPSLYLYLSVIAVKATDSVLDAMKLMSDEGVSTIAVIEEDTGNLLSAVSVTDIGKIVVPAQSNQILSAPLHQFVSLIKEPDGSTDGADKYPVYSVSPSNTLFYAMQKLLATDSHRLFVTDDSALSPTFPPSSSGSLSGIVSTVDVLSLFARLANLPDVDPKRMQRHRRASSTSSQSSSSHSSDPSNFSLGLRSRSSSRTSLGRLSASAGEAGHWPERVPDPRK